MNFAFIIGFTLQIIVIYTPGLRDLFEFVPMEFKYFAISIGLSFVIVIIMELYKLILRIKAKKN